MATGRIYHGAERQMQIIAHKTEWFRPKPNLHHKRLEGDLSASEMFYWPHVVLRNDSRLTHNWPALMGE